MPTLAEKLLLPDVRPKVVADSARLVDEEVRDKSGLSGFAIKAAYAVVKAVKPGIIPEVLDAMLDGFIGRLEPPYVEWQKAPSVPFELSISALSRPRTRSCRSPTSGHESRRTRP